MWKTVGNCRFQNHSGLDTNFTGPKFIYQVCSTISPNFFLYGLFMPVLSRSAIIHWIACYYGARTSELCLYMFIPTGTKVCFKSFVTQIIERHNFFNICSRAAIIHWIACCYGARTSELCLYMFIPTGTKVCFKSFVTQIIKRHNFFNICSRGHNSKCCGKVLSRTTSA